MHILKQLTEGPNRNEKARGHEDMEHRHRSRFCVVAVIASMAVVLPALGQPPVDTPDTTRPSQLAPKSDEHRIVGRVLQIDQEQQLAKLATDEGVVSVEVPSRTLRAFRVGDVVSVPRSPAEFPSALPRNK